MISVRHYLVLRGGSWISDARFCRSADRFTLGPGPRNDHFGFRLARGLPEVHAGRTEPAGVEGGPEARLPGDGAPGLAARLRGREFFPNPRSKGKP